MAVICCVHATGTTTSLKSTHILRFGHPSRCRPDAEVQLPGTCIAHMTVRGSPSVLISKHFSK